VLFDQHVQRFVDDAHAAFADRAHDLVARVERGADEWIDRRRGARDRH
jgi:hypothetical protein